MGFPQSSHAWTGIDSVKDFWYFCDRCGFRRMRGSATWQHDFRGLQLQNLHILVCTETCNDEPQSQLRPIIVGPDPVSIPDARPGWQASQAGYGGVSNILELVDGDILPPPGGGLGNNNGVLYLTSPSGWPTSDLLVPAGRFWSNGGEATIAAGVFAVHTAIPIVFGSISASQLLSYNAGYLPQTPPATGSGILWNPWGTDGGPIFVA